MNGKRRRRFEQLEGRVLLASDVVIQEIMYHPASEDSRDEYLELYNAGDAEVSLADWRFTNGVAMVLPDYTLPAGETVVVAADVARFRETYGDLPNLIGGWSKELSDRGETIELVNAVGELVDRVQYADEGDWAVRVRGREDRNHEGWAWSDAHDGGGHSLELINAALDNNIGQNWAASTASGGSPGIVNGAQSADTAPLIHSVSHAPAIPSSSDPVLVQARVLDEQPILVAELHWRADGASVFQAISMKDSGTDGDLTANDGVFSATIPAQADRSVVEFYITATDASSQSRRYPNVNTPTDRAPNLLYQVENSFAAEQRRVAQGDLDAQPIFRLIMTEVERAELASIGAGRDADSNAEMNGTFVSFDGTDVEYRYNVGIRNRGKGSRDNPPNNYRVNFANDQPWQQVRAINLNSKQPLTQVLGSAFFRQAGIVTADATAVQVRVNGSDLSVGDPKMYGSYNYLEVINSDFAEHHFPQDDQGNAYTGGWIGRNQADLRDEGSDADAYRDRYKKNTNESEDDWSDLLSLIDVLNNTPQATLLTEVEKLADVDQWIRYLAADTILTNRETSPSNGIGDDYRLYHGQDQQRFVFIPHDLDSILGVTDSRFDYDIWLPAEMDGLSRLLGLPEVAERFYATLVELLDTVFNSEQAARTVDQMLGSWVPEQTRNQLLQFLARRAEFVRSRIPQQLTAATELALQNDLPLTSEATVGLTGEALAARTSRVEVNEIAASYDPQAARWSLSVPLVSGLNRFEVKSFDAQGAPTDSTTFDVLRNDIPTTTLSGTLSDSQMLTSDQVWRVEANLIVPAGVTLNVNPGTLVTVANGSSIRVEGRLVAIGEPHRPIRFTRADQTGAWNGVQFVNTPEANLLRYVDFAYSDGNDESILVDHATLDMHGVRWFNTTGTSLELFHPTLTVTDSVFPSVVDNETIHGSGLTGSERLVLRGNTFGSTTGYSDIIDFTGGQRPGPILEVIGNHFTGGSDDGLDLDGTDAYIAGNVFRHIHKDNTSESSSNAIATGVDSGDASELVIVGNVFYDVDNALLLKERSSAVFLNNLVIQAAESGINFDEPNRDVDPGVGIEIEGSLFWQTETILNNIGPDPEFGVPEIHIDYSLLPDGWHDFGIGNFAGDPGIVDFEHFLLRNDSPAFTIGRNATPIGPGVPLLTATISGEPSSHTASHDARLTVAGPDIVSYRYRLAGTEDAWSPTTPTSTPIQLSDLTAGNHAVEVIGIDSRGVMQSETEPTVSRLWTVVENLLPIVISEVYANSGPTRADGTNGDWMELHNPNSVAVDLSGMSLSDDASDPVKFVIPAGTLLDAGEYLYLPSFSEGGALASGLRFSSEGDSLYLYRSADGQPELIDSISFGLQIPEYSIGRVGSDGGWSLTQITPGSANRIQPMSTAANLRINEWFTSGDVRLSNDFVELVNPDTLPVQLAGRYLSDNPMSWSDRHQVASLSFIAAEGYSVLVADGDTAAGADHLGFRLRKSTGQIGLFDSDRTRIDHVVYAPLPTDTSEGLTASGHFARFVLPTPGLPNGEEGEATVESVELVNLTGLWRYNDMGADLGQSWRERDFDDSDWPLGAGPLGLESSSLPVPLETPLSLGPITYYFRTTFSFDGDANTTEFYLQTLLDDGAVFYLNGVEARRINLPSGDIDSETRATAAVGTASLSDTSQIAFDSLVQGTNVLAVEVHQASSTSSDVVFAASVSALTTQTSEPELSENVKLLQSLRITELMYHPADNEDLEFLELSNVGAMPLELQGVRIAEGIDFVFPEVILGPGEVVVVAKSVAAFQQHYGNQIRVVGDYDGRLNNAGEELRLLLPSPQSVVIHRFEYRDSGPWPTLADGLGSSLEIVDIDGDYREALNWKASATAGGTPGSVPRLRAFGDVNRDGVIDAADIDRLFTALRDEEIDEIFDLDANGVVQTPDVDLLVETVLQTTYGDANLDGAVGFADFLLLSQHFGTAGGWSEGDFDGNASIDFADFLLLSRNFTS